MLQNCSQEISLVWFRTRGDVKDELDMPEEEGRSVNKLLTIFLMGEYEECPRSNDDYNQH